ncbi:MAG: acyl-CoA synthetase [Xanthobacteraceae bacterium]|nr:acyl-CoA synthetase [Xanthobacteraceae bacterium]QYK45699.1 MAG: acyl-CoA synthetase [Xanthobacteraceae bacterium]
MFSLPEDSIYRTGLDRNTANYVPLSPIVWLRRAATISPDAIAMVHGARRFSYREFEERCRRLGSALKQRGIKPGDTVSVLAPNIPAAIESHYGVPGIGAVVNPLNIRLDARTVAFILRHSEAKVLIVDADFAQLASEALAMLDTKPLIVDIDDGAGPGRRIGEIEYEELLESGDPAFALEGPSEEWHPLALSYTSGTTGDPKGVVYHHRGAYLNALANIAAWELPKRPVLLWTLPVFHSLGWCFPWSVTLMGGTHVCLRKVEARAIYSTIVSERVSHMCGAPIVLSTLINAPDEEVTRFDWTVKMMLGGSPPPATVLEKAEQRGFDIMHAYGLTEVYGAAVFCEWRPEWDNLPNAQRAERKARQGVAYPLVDDLRVMNPDTMRDVPKDGHTMGEVMKRSNTIMAGYLKNPKSTEAAFAGGYFHTGDLAVQHPDGYIELKDRSKDIIISGGENISTIEVEAALYRYPGVLEVAVVARPDEKWGETPCAFVLLKPGEKNDADAIIAHCRAELARYKVPAKIVFGPLPKTATGKVQKFLLRQQAAQL